MGCAKYVGIPLDVVMGLPIQERREYIRLHNMEQEKYENAHKPKDNENVRSYEGQSINEFAKLTQTNSKRGII